MDNEQTHTPPAEEKPAAKRTAARKPRATKSTTKAVAAQESTLAAAAPTVEATPARKPRTTKSTTKSATKAVAAQESDTKKTRKPRKKANDGEQSATPLPAPVSEPAPLPAPEPRHEPQPAPTPEPKLREDREERAAEHVNVPREQPHDNDPAPAHGFAVPETVGGNEGGNGGNNRRKRRRNRNRRGNESQSAQPQVPQGRVDADELVRRAWKIYLGEVTEEGLALMDDRTAAEASRRAFRVAELFLVEASRHRRHDRPQQTPAEDDDSHDKSSPED